MAAGCFGSPRFTRELVIFGGGGRRGRAARLPGLILFVWDVCLTARVLWHLNFGDSSFRRFKIGFLGVVANGESMKREELDGVGSILSVQTLFCSGFVSYSIYPALSSLAAAVIRL